jgi:RNAse (barnase) inhibitor barstar
MLKYLLHAGAIIKLLQNVENLIAEEFRQKGFVPSKAQVQPILDGIKDLIDDEVIEVPGMKVEDLDSIWQGIEAGVLSALK